MYIFCIVLLFLFKQKTAYEMRISDWSSDVCSSDLGHAARSPGPAQGLAGGVDAIRPVPVRPGVAPGRDRDSGLAYERALFRSEERRVGKECVSTCRDTWSP